MPERLKIKDIEKELDALTRKSHLLHRKILAVAEEYSLIRNRFQYLTTMLKNAREEYGRYLVSTEL